MFVLDEETRNFWFNFKAVDALDEFRLVGWLLGLAVYNNVILDIHFPPIVYKKLNLQTHEEMAYQVGVLPVLYGANYSSRSSMCYMEATVR